MNKRRRLVVGNWKMFIESPDDAKRLAQGIRKRARTWAGVEVWLAPSYPLIPVVATAIGGSRKINQKGSAIKVGAQSVSVHEDHQHTGEVSATMLKASGASFAIAGHSEERAAGMSDALVHEQLVRTAGAGLTTILCVGERERDQSGSHFAFVEAQLRSAFHGAQSFASRVVVAYEPVWAIGHSAQDAVSPALLEEMVIFIRKTLADILGRQAALRVPILYGGSVEPQNALHLIEERGVGGFLVGHASAKLEDFLEILKTLRKAQGK